MSTSVPSSVGPAIEYPDCDGEPIADNTLQFDWIVMIYVALLGYFGRGPDVFVAADLLWYPVEGDPTIRLAPDGLVAFGRPAGYRGSYKQWEEGGIAPQVVFEVLSPESREAATSTKFAFYDRYGVEEYYAYDPERNELMGWRRVDDRLRTIEVMRGWVSPRLGLRFEPGADKLRLYRPDGQEVLTYQQMLAAREKRERADRLAGSSGARGVDPDTV